jgi:hypothetical protein
MSKEIDALVAEVLDDRRVVLNVGSESGVSDGDAVRLWRVVTVTDPVTDDVLGDVRIDRLLMEVSAVYEKLCIASVRRSSSMFPAQFAGTNYRLAEGAKNRRLISGEVAVDRGDQVTVYPQEDSLGSGTGA